MEYFRRRTMQKRPPSWEIPDLDLAPEPSRHASGGSQENHGLSRPSDTLDELELDPNNGIPARVGGLEPENLDPLESMDDLGVGLSLGIADNEFPRATTACTTSEPWPHLRPISVDNFAPLTEEIAALRPWGEPPTHLLATVLYAFQVLRGSRQLERQIAAQRQQVAQCAAAREDAAVLWFEQHHFDLQNNPRYASELNSLDGVVGVFEHQRHRKSELTDGAQRDRRDLEQNIAVMRERIVGRRSQQQSIVEGHREAQRDLNRASARLQRLDIELRTGHLDAFVYAEQTARLRSSVQKEQERVSRLANEVTGIEQSIVADELGLRMQEDRLRQQQRTGQVAERAAQLAFDEARNAASLAKMELLSRLLIVRDTELFAPSVRAQWFSRERELTEAVRRLACLLAAMNAFERSRVRQGLWLSLFVVALLVVPVLLQLTL